jgi:3-hydroxybutyryl-CoA dehydrogenase
MSMDASALHSIGVVGAGAMGSGVAQTALAAGLRVILYDLDRAALDDAREQIFARLARLAQKGLLRVEGVEQARSRLLIADELSAMAPAQVVVEAIVEKLEVKQSLFAALEAIVAETAVLATNTSSLPVAAIARRCKQRGRVCGMHFFNPVPLMKLVEVIGTPDTSEATMQTALALAARLDKTAVRVKDVPGFLVNLLGRAYSTEALHLLHEGVAPAATIDRIMREAAGFRMGPFELMDLTGIDVNFPATSFIYQGFQHDPRLKTTILHEALFNAGRFGRKSGEGFHTYAESPPPPPVENPPGSAAAVTAFVCEDHSGFVQLQSRGLPLVERESAEVLLISPTGEDASSVCARLDLDPKRAVAVDFTGLERNFVTLMSPPGGHGSAEKLAAFLGALGYNVAVIRDSPGFVALRVLAMIANLGCEVAQIGVVDGPEQIDVAMRLAQNYPRGPLEWAEWLGPPTVLETLQQMQLITGSDRYRPSLWLRRRASLGLPIRTRD